MTTKILRLPEVLDRIGMSKWFVYRHMKRGTFPARVRMGAAVGWTSESIDAWIAARAAESQVNNPQGEKQ